MRFRAHPGNAARTMPGLFFGTWRLADLATWFFGPLLLALCACSTLPPPDPRLERLPADAVRLPRVPLPPADERADRAILSAFFEANHAPITADECAQILDHPLAPGRMERAVLVRTARLHDLVLMTFNANRRHLPAALRSGRVLLLYLPAADPRAALPELAIPVACSESDPATVWLLRGDGSVSPIPADDFFARRAPLKQAALCLVAPSGLAAFARDAGQKEPTRSQKLLLADFWYGQGQYRRAAASYSSLLEAPDDDAPFDSLDALLGRADSLVKLRKYSQAVRLYRQALEQTPDNPRLLNNLAYALMLENQNVLEALVHANRARELDPRNPLVLETVGALNLRVGDCETAARTLELAWGHALRRPPEVQIAIMDQLVRAWLCSDRADLAYQVAEYRRRMFPEYKMPADILAQFPALRRLPTSPEPALP